MKAFLLNNFKRPLHDWQLTVSRSLLCRRSMSLLSGNGDRETKEAHSWLTHTGATSEVADEILLVFKKLGGPVSSSGLKQLGEEGLKQLVLSVERDLEERAKKKSLQKKKISIFIDNPRISKDKKRVDILANETLFNTTCTPIIDDLEFACGGNAACSTCHVIIPKEYFDILPKPEEDELDMLDLAWGCTDTSRLACQMEVTEECEGMVVSVPSEANNLF